MDISHINRIGKYLDKIEEWPCCQPTGHEDFETTPSRLNFKQLLNDLPWSLPRDLNEQEYSYLDCEFEPSEQRLPWFLKSNSCSPRQNRAIDAFQVIRREVLRNFKPHGVNIGDVRQFAACFDALLFEGKILPRCAIHWCVYPPGEHGAECDISHYCPKHKQSHAVCILLDRDEFMQGDKNTLHFTPEYRLEVLLSVLLHEMCHAWVLLFSDTRGTTVEEALREQGFEYHGLAWTWVMRIGLTAASHFFGIRMNQYKYCEHIFSDERTIKNNIKDLGEKIASTSESPEYFHSMIQWRLDVKPDRASHFFHLLDKGFTIVQALALVKNACPEIWLSPEMEALVPKEWSYIEHKSLHDRNYWKPEVPKEVDDNVGGWGVRLQDSNEPEHGEGAETPELIFHSRAGK